MGMMGLVCLFSQQRNRANSAMPPNRTYLAYPKFRISDRPNIIRTKAME